MPLGRFRLCYPSYLAVVALLLGGWLAYGAYAALIEVRVALNRATDMIALLKINSAETAGEIKAQEIGIKNGKPSDSGQELAAAFSAIVSNKSYDYNSHNQGLQYNPFQQFEDAVFSAKDRQSELRRQLQIDPRLTAEWLKQATSNGPEHPGFHEAIFFIMHEQQLTGQLELDLRATLRGWVRREPSGFRNTVLNMLADAYVANSPNRGEAIMEVKSILRDESSEILILNIDRNESHK